MAFDNVDLADLIDAAADQGPDMNEAAAGGERELPAEGSVRLRLVSYIELGMHMDKQQTGPDKKKDFVTLEFECSGPKHPLKEDGTPHIVQVRLTKSLNEKAHYFKLFKRLNHDGTAKHFAQLLGKAFKGTIVHNTTGEGDKKRTYVNLKNADGYTIYTAFYENEDGESIPLKVEAQRVPSKLFIWDAPKGLKDMWDSIFIDGYWESKAKEGEEVKKTSKNFYQERIRAALNFKGSQIEALVGGAAIEDLGIEGAEQVERGEPQGDGAEADPLAGM